MTSAADRVLRGLLLAYPRDFRERFGDEMRFAALARLATVRSLGAAATIRFWAGAVWDALSQGLAERVAASRGRVRYASPGPFSGGAENAMGKLLQDVRYAWRSIARSPAGTLICVLTLGVGIGATTAIFTVVDSVILEPLPYPDSDRLVSIHRSVTASDRESSAPLDLADWERDVAAFQEIGGFSETSASFELDGGVEQIQGGRMSAGMFPTLGVPPLHGRWFVAEEDVIGGPDAVILSHAMWRDRYGADTGLVGRPIEIDDRPRTVVGVMPPGFSFPTPEAEYWIPLRGDEALRLAGVEAPGRGLGFIGVVARLAPGETHESALAELQRVTAAIDAAEPQAETRGVTFLPLHTDVVGDVRLALFTFLGAVAIVLLVSCANVANLSLVRAASRETEMAVRSALGAGRGRIIRLVLTESALVGLAGGLVG
ncbi:MAG: ABC transporter permease, partial [Gemmatimonadota bacterium]|nr:ABC transporter permease [Gemmatimonadota bacterium]